MNTPDPSAQEVPEFFIVEDGSQPKRLFIAKRNITPFIVAEVGGIHWSHLYGPEDRQRYANQIVSALNRAPSAEVAKLREDAGGETPETDAVGINHANATETEYKLRKIARVIERQRDEAMRQLISLQQRCDALEKLEIQRSGTLGRIAIALYGEQNNVTDDECEMGVKAAVMEREQYKKAHQLFDADLVELLSRCQRGEATCIFTAQIIEAKLNEAKTKASAKATNETSAEVSLRIGGRSHDEETPDSSVASNSAINHPKP